MTMNNSSDYQARSARRQSRQSSRFNGICDFVSACLFFLPSSVAVAQVNTSRMDHSMLMHTQ